MSLRTFSDVDFSCRKTGKGRRKTTTGLRVFRDGEQISRHEALNRICRHLNIMAIHPEVLRLMNLFSFDPEELSEAGISYECLKVLESLALFF